MLDSWFDPRLAAFVRGNDINFLGDSIQVVPLDWHVGDKRLRIVEIQVDRIRRVLELSKEMQFTKEFLADHLLCLCYLWLNWLKPNPEVFIYRKVHDEDTPWSPSRLLCLKGLVVDSWRLSPRESIELNEFLEQSWKIALRYAQECRWIELEKY